MTVYVALLRGVNVGGKNTINMAELKRCFENLGFEHVLTYINSGNVMFQSTLLTLPDVENYLEAQLESRFGLRLKVVVRSLNQMEQIIKHIPASWASNQDQKCSIIFLKKDIDSPEILNMLSIKSDIESLFYAPGVLYWSARTADLTKSTMIKLSQKPVYQDMTVRNLNTTRHIYDHMRTNDI